MKVFLGILAIGLSVFNSPATTRFVDVNSTNPVSPYTNWITAATNIQDAISAPGGFGDTVLVTNGIYQYGGDLFDGSNRVHVINGVTLTSVNGPAVTIIKGSQGPVTTNGTGAVRCVFLQEFTKISGFTLTNGATPQNSVGGGGVATDTSCVISNCIITGNASGGAGGGASLLAGTLMSDCIVSGNIVYNGYSGGGVFGAGTGTTRTILVNCIVSNNIAATDAGVVNCQVFNSLFVGNGTTNTMGSAAHSSALFNCTIVGNISRAFGAANACALCNSIIYYNSNVNYADCYQCQLTNCCTTIGLGNVTFPNNSFSNAPGFVNLTAGNYHLLPWSRGIDSGNSALATNSLDLDGNPRIAGAAVDLGAYENQSPLQSLAHYVSLLSTNPVSPYTSWSTAATNLQDGVNAALPGDFVIADDGTYTNSSTGLAGVESNRVVLTNGVTLASAGGPQAAAISGGIQTRGVYLGSNSVLMGFTVANGRTRPTGDVTNEESGGGVWCEQGGTISNCWILGNNAALGGAWGGGVFRGSVFDSVLANNNAAFGGGGAFGNYFNCVFITNALTGGKNGGGIYGGVASNCTFVANGKFFGITGGGACDSTLYRCTLATNTASSGGGGADSSTLFNCTILGNQSLGNGAGTQNCTNFSCKFLDNSSSSSGGGAVGGYAYNSIFSRNRAMYGGAVENCKLLNCTVVGNMATNGTGGVSESTVNSVNNSIVYYNTSLGTGNPNESGDTLDYCCVTPVIFSFSTSFTNEPLLVDWTNGDFRLQSNSPCINSGYNPYLNHSFTFSPLTNDFAGNPRIIGGTVDVGAYEYPSPASTIAYWWLSRHGFPLDGSGDTVDEDGDGMDNYAEWRAGTDPTNGASLLTLQSATVTATNATIRWQSVSAVLYYVQRTPDLFAQPFVGIASNIFGSSGTTSYTDTNAAPGFAVFYRVGVQ